MSRCWKRIEQCVALARQHADANKLGDGARERLATLTRASARSWNWWVAGKSNKLIAAELHISIKTVEAHRAKIMHKTAGPFNCRTRQPRHHPPAI